MIAQELERCEAENRPIRVGVSGAGWIGSGFVRQVSLMKGMRVSVVADPDVAAARRAFEEAGVPAERICAAETPDEAMDALQSGKRVVTGSYSLAAQLEDVDIVADVTPSPAAGAETATACIQHGKDMVMVNIEADVTVGRILKKMAAEAGVLYTVSSGDEPGCLMELWDFVTSLGYEPIVIGKGKNNPLDPSATPDMVAESARKSNKNPYQVASYVDGTKTMFEMTCAANATGCRPIQRGMVGPQADLTTVSRIFALEADGGITTISPHGRFCAGERDVGGRFCHRAHRGSPRLRGSGYLKVGKGHYYTFFRPYHLWFLEAPISVARAYFYRQTTLTPLDLPVADVITVAKRDLRPGERLDEFGGYTFYGVMEEADMPAIWRAAGRAGPRGGCQPIHLGGPLVKWEDVRLDENQTVVELRRAPGAADHHPV